MEKLEDRGYIVNIFWLAAFRQTTFDNLTWVVSCHFYIKAWKSIVWSIGGNSITCIEFMSSSYHFGLNTIVTIVYCFFFWYFMVCFQWLIFCDSCIPLIFTVQLVCYRYSNLTFWKRPNSLGIEDAMTELRLAANQKELLRWKGIRFSWIFGVGRV